MKSICFDWGDTLMVDFPQYNGPMKDWPEVSLLSGVQDALQTLHTEHDLYVATNASASSAEDVRSALARVEIDSYIQEVFTRHELNAEKPAREFFERLLKKFDDSAAAFVGDHYQKDILGAHHAGMKTFWYNPNFAAAPAHLPLQDAEFSHFSQLADLIKLPLLPGFDTCQVWLLEQPCGFGLLQHNLTVAAIAYQMALWCNENNQAVNTLLVHRAAYLHDLGKLLHDETCNHHGECGANILRQKGFEQIAAIVEKHPLLCLLDAQQQPASREEIIVYLADKYAEGSRIVPLEDRLNGLLNRYPRQQNQIQAVSPRLMELQNECCDWMGFSPLEITTQLQQALR